MKNVKSQKKSPEIIIRGGGDIATGTILRLHRVGFKVLVLETAQPTAIRRTVSFSEAVTFNECEVEGSRARLIENISQCSELWQKNEIPVLVDPEMRCLENLSDVILVDAILAKKGGLYKTLSSLSYSIALGPGFSAGEDVDAVIETCRGHNLGRIIRTGKALANTGLPGEIGGFQQREFCTPP